MKRLAALLAALLAWSPVLAKDATPFDPKGDASAQAAKFLKASKLDALSGTKRVAISQFRVEFAIENKAHAHSSASGGWTSSNADITLVGVSDELRQVIADQLHDNLVSALTEAGIEVVPYETVSQDANYQSMEKILKRGQVQMGVMGGKSVFVGANGQPIYRTNDDRHIGLSDALGWVPDQTQFLFVTPDSGKARVTLAKTILMGGDALEFTDTTTRGEKTTEAAFNVLGAVLGSGGGTKTRHFQATANPDAYLVAVTEYGVGLESALLALVKPAL